MFTNIAFMTNKLQGFFKLFGRYVANGTSCLYVKLNGNYASLWGPGLMAPVLKMAQNENIAHLVFGWFRIVESQNGRTTA